MKLFSVMKLSTLTLVIAPNSIILSSIVLPATDLGIYIWLPCNAPPFSCVQNSVISHHLITFGPAPWSHMSVFVSLIALCDAHCSCCRNPCNYYFFCLLYYFIFFRCQPGLWILASVPIMSLTSFIRQMLRFCTVRQHPFVSLRPRSNIFSIT